MAIVSLWVKRQKVAALTILCRKEEAVDIKPLSWSAERFQRTHWRERCSQLYHSPQHSSLPSRKLWFKVVERNIPAHSNICWLSIDMRDMYNVCNKVLNSSCSTTNDYFAVHAYQNTGKQSSYPGVSTPYFPASHTEVARSTCLAQERIRALHYKQVKDNKHLTSALTKKKKKNTKNKKHHTQIPQHYTKESANS